MAHTEYLAEVQGHPRLTTAFDTYEMAEAYAMTHSVWQGRSYRVTEIIVGDPIEGEVA